MLGLNKTAFGVIGILGAFVGYCFYFDHKRRNDPDYKRKVRERRQRMHEKTLCINTETTQVQLNSQEDIHRFFLQEIQLGDQDIARGDFESGVNHLAQAFVVCEQPVQLLQIMQTNLPPPVFMMLMQRVQEIQIRARNARLSGDHSNVE